MQAVCMRHALEVALELCSMDLAIYELPKEVPCEVSRGGDGAGGA